LLSTLSSIRFGLNNGRAHLYRHHRIFQCQRCKGLFLNQNVLDEHILALQGCEPNLVNLAEGITADIEKRLRCRKKTHPHQTETERWNEIYQILFPAAVLPSPCGYISLHHYCHCHCSTLRASSPELTFLVFEPVEESIDQPSDSAKLADFEAYTQRELPKMFWAALEEVVAIEMQPVEERLRTQLMGVIRDCQDRVFSTYQSMVTSTIDTLLHDNLTRDRLLNQFEPLSRTTSAQGHLRSSLSLTGLCDTSAASDTNGSGRGSNLSGFNSSTTLSSIFNSSTTLSSVFNSSTTLSSIASSHVSPAIQPTNTKLPCNADEITTCAFGANDGTEGAAAMLPNDFWATDADTADLSQFDADGMWNTGATAYENPQ
jgi:hypothetical protein